MVISQGPVGRDGLLLWVAMITSRENGAWPGDHPIDALAEAGLPIPSVVRPAKITTVDARDAEPVGSLNEALTRAVIDTIASLMGRKNS